MNWSHLRATLWLRWRILVNRVKRTSRMGSVLFGLLIVLALCACTGIFVLALGLGLELLPDFAPLTFMLIWSGLALGFLFAWMIGLLTDLQHGDALSFKNLLHLPVSLGWIFLYNYLSSFVSLSVAIFLPAMLGACVAMVIVNGPQMLLTLPLLLGFFLMITALTYQLRGLLARMMEDRRRGRNIIAGITVGFVLLLQVPNLINLSMQSSRIEERVRAETELEDPQQDALEELELDRKLTLAAQLIPLGWLPYGMRVAYQGRWLPAGLCTFGLLLISVLSLRRSYRTTLAVVVGAGSSEASAAPAAARGADESGEGERKTLLVQRRLPFVGELESGIACAGLRSLLRAPEAKMLLLGPAIVLGLFGVMLFNNPKREMLGPFAPSIALGAISLGMLCIMQLIQNQFGLDRAGFRSFVLSPVPRRRILLGKNLATAPFALGIACSALIGLQFLVPMDFAHMLGACFQSLSAYMLLCMVGNTISILGPMRLKGHGMRADKAKFKTILWQLISMLLVPVALSPLLVPAGLESLLSFLGSAAPVSLYPILHAVGLIAIYFVYRWILRHQGALMQSREQHILDSLTGG